MSKNSQSKQTCVICGKEFEEWGNNPHPIYEEGVCCDSCDYEKVIPARIEFVILSKNDFVHKHYLSWCEINKRKPHLYSSLLEFKAFVQQKKGGE